jgi:hypothetical protein
LDILLYRFCRLCIVLGAASFVVDATSWAMLHALLDAP